MKIILISLLIFVSVWISYAIPNNFLPLEIFKLEEVKIEVKSKKLARELTKLLDSLYNMNIWQIDTNEIKNYLEKDIRIKKASVFSKTLGQLEIVIEEREPKYYAQIGDKIYLVDEEGLVFGYLKDKSQIDTYFIKGKDVNEIKSIIPICKIIDESTFINFISQINLLDKNCIEIILSDKTILKTDFNVKQDKYRIVEYLYGTLSKKNSIEYIDLRFRDFIVKIQGDEKNGK